VRKQTPIFERGLLVGDVPLRDPARPTFYVRAGDWLPILCWLASAALLVRRAAGRRA
jgi:apolipoprotein N-acyltransferase